ncbi:unnamed protein product [Amoebophrya sp. A25]|nr:unnamed protein product [Amoebophrya sp. A25]|eukprot:GSA25T00027599001.1
MLSQYEKMMHLLSKRLKKWWPRKDEDADWQNAEMSDDSDWEQIDDGDEELDMQPEAPSRTARGFTVLVLGTLCAYTIVAFICCCSALMDFFAADVAENTIIHTTAAPKAATTATVIDSSLPFQRKYLEAALLDLDRSAHPSKVVRKFTGIANASEAAGMMGRDSLRSFIRQLIVRYNGAEGRNATESTSTSVHDASTLALMVVDDREASFSYVNSYTNFRLQQAMVDAYVSRVTRNPYSMVAQRRAMDLLPATAFEIHAPTTKLEFRKFGPAEMNPVANETRVPVTPFVRTPRAIVETPRAPVRVSSSLSAVMASSNSRLSMNKRRFSTRFPRWFFTSFGGRARFPAWNLTTPTLTSTTTGYVRRNAFLSATAPMMTPRRSSMLSTTTSASVQAHANGSVPASMPSVLSSTRTRSFAEYLRTRKVAAAYNYTQGLALKSGWFQHRRTLLKPLEIPAWLSMSTRAVPRSWSMPRAWSSIFSTHTRSTTTSAATLASFAESIMPTLRQTVGEHLNLAPMYNKSCLGDIMNTLRRKVRVRSVRSRAWSISSTPSDMFVVDHDMEEQQLSPWKIETRSEERAKKTVEETEIRANRSTVQEKQLFMGALIAIPARTARKERAYRGLSPFRMVVHHALLPPRKEYQLVVVPQGFTAARFFRKNVQPKLPRRANVNPLTLVQQKQMSLYMEVVNPRRPYLLTGYGFGSAGGAVTGNFTLLVDERAHSILSYNGAPSGAKTLPSALRSAISAFVQTFRGVLADGNVVATLDKQEECPSVEQEFLDELWEERDSRFLLPAPATRLCSRLVNFVAGNSTSTAVMPVNAGPAKAKAAYRALLKAEAAKKARAEALEKKQRQLAVAGRVMGVPSYSDIARVWKQSALIRPQAFTPKNGGLVKANEEVCPNEEVTSMRARVIV